jgi:predicted dehydrogenase
MAVVRFALVGCGRIAENHLAAIQQTSRAQIAAVCDLIPERAQIYSRRFDVPAYDNYHEMLRKESTDVVCILTPSGMHPAHVIDILSTHRKHVVVEKPCALSLPDVQAMLIAAEKVDRKIFPVYQHRYNKAVRTVKDALVSGDMGKPVLAAVRVRWCRPQSYYDRDRWRGTWSLDGGALTNQGIHYLDLLLHFLGEAEEVYGMTATRLVNAEVEDTAAATLRFESGALGVIEVTTAARPYDLEGSVSVLAERGTAVLGGIACNELKEWTIDPAACPQNSEMFPNVYGLGHTPFIQDVVADLLDGLPHPISLEEGSRALRLLNAIYRSAEDGVPVLMKHQPSSRRLGQPDASLRAPYLTPLQR